MSGPTVYMEYMYLHVLYYNYIGVLRVQPQAERGIQYTLLHQSSQ